MSYVVKGAAARSKVDFIVLNDTRNPTTGGDYVYAVMKDELMRQGYRTSEVSIPSLIDPFKTRISNDWKGRASLLSAETLAYLRCCTSSLKRFTQGSHLIITSSCPTFPVFGHVTYHQPKAGICTDFIKRRDSMKRMIGYRVQENEKLSPLWLLAKKLIRLHLSNSAFTKKLVRQIYGLDSTVLYPPVPVLKYLKADLHSRRKPYVFVTRPQAITGISLLPQIAQHLPRTIKLIITGKLDQTGNNALRFLKNAGANFEYLGFVEESVKMDILCKSSVYINLAVNETFGITAVEAMAAGCIPVAHDSGSIPEFLPPEFRYSTVDECVGKIKMYVDRRGDLREQLRAMALRFEEARFRRNFMFFVKHIETSLEKGSDPAAMSLSARAKKCQVCQHV